MFEIGSESAVDPDRPNVKGYRYVFPVRLADSVSNHTDRIWMRQLTLRAELWTEMVVDDTILNSKSLHSHLAYSREEHPIVCQLGGSNPEKMARAAKVVEDWGYDAINVNVGCPSKRVANCGMFGAQLLRDPENVREILKAMKGAVKNSPISVKTRIGLDDNDSFDWIAERIVTIAESGVDRFIMHARSAWLTKIISPHQNRTLPPLNYDR